MSEKILMVDDDRNLLAACERNFHRRFQIDTAEGAEAGLQKIASSGPYALVISDRQMPGMDGIAFLAAVKEKAPDTVRVMLTGNADLDGTIKVVNEGNIFRFLNKPCPVELLGKVMEDGVNQYRLVMAERELLNKTLNGSIKLLTDILSMLEPESFGRAEAVRKVITEVCSKFNVVDEWEVQLAFMLAPIGRVTVPPEVLQRARRGELLSKVESQLVAGVPETAARLLDNIPRLTGVAKIVRYQHKNFDGTGVPADGVKGEAIPFGARLLKVLDELAQMQNDGMVRSRALLEMGALPGRYDSRMLAVVKNFYEESVTQTIRSDLPIAIADLAPGMVLRTNIETTEGTLILCSGHHLTEMTLEKIKNFDRISGIKQPVFVEMPEGVSGSDGE